MSNGRGHHAARELGLGEGFDMPLACSHVYHMLCGLSLEVAMKAALVSQGITPPEKHDLNLLAHLLSVKRNPAQKKILNFYQHSVVWAGRYPVPVNATDEKLIDYYEMANTVLYKGKTVIKGTTINIKTYSPTGATSWERYDALYKSYTALFDHRYPGATHGRA
jgi:HEPN domain-containing protein